MNLPGRIAFKTLRALERMVPPSLLAVALREFSSFANPFSRESVVPPVEQFKALSRISAAFPIPDAKRIARERTLNRLDRMAACWPDRYREKKWKSRCRIDGLAGLQELAKQKRPVVLPTFHFGPLFIHRYWLRAHDLPVANLIREDTAARSPFREEKDRLSGAKRPHVFSVGRDLKEAARWLQGGGMLLIPIDLPTTRDLTVPVREGHFRLSTGFVRLARKHSAAVIPTLSVHTGPFEWEIHLAEPWKPDGTPPDSEQAALLHTVNSLLPILEKHPEQIRGELLDCIVSDEASPGSRHGREGDPIGEDSLHRQHPPRRT